MKRILFTILSIVLGSTTVFSVTSVLQFGSINSLLADDEMMNYTIIELGTLGGPESTAADINNKGQVVGSSATSEDLLPTAFFWDEGSIVPLTAAAGMTTTAYAINDSGLIAGTAISGADTPQNQWPVIWANGIYTQLATISDTQGTARAVNNVGITAGNTVTVSDNHLLMWQDGSLLSTVPISGGVGWVNGLNESGKLAGYVDDLQGKNTAFLWASGVLTDLGTLGGSNNIARDINDLGQIVGSSTLSDEVTSRAFSWNEGVMSDLGGLGNVVTETSRANGINNGGIVVGQAQLGQENIAVMWKNGQIIDLNDLLPADSGWDVLQSAESINDDDWIVGTGLIEGHKRAFLLRPAPPLSPVFLPVVVIPDPTPTPTPVPTATPSPSPTPTSTPVPSGVLDMERFLIGDGRLYEVKHSNNSQARHQTQIEGVRFFHTKGEGYHRAEWEELWSKSNYIYRGTDTSPGNGRYYSLYADSKSGSPVGSKWSPQRWRVGDKYERNAYVVVRNKSDCSIVPNLSGWANTWLRFEAYYPQYTFASGITLKNVIQLAWLLTESGQPQEYYFYAQDYGLVGWKSADAGQSYINEIHQPGQRPDNSREVIPCLDQLHKPLVYSPELNYGPLPEWYLHKIK